MSTSIPGIEIRLPISTVSAPHPAISCLTPDQKVIFRSHLLCWYDHHARALPWREDREPYRVWLSEVMLQQTRVAAVIQHYRRLLQRFPTVKKLAMAREASVLAAWSGLGYYRRARMLHAAAKVIVRNLNGKFPSSSQELLKLPGIGRYTAAAIASIAFQEPVAVVDGNVERVLQRLLGSYIQTEALWSSANDLLDRSRPGDFNQALMELGATVCTPRAPACLMCPVIEMCATRGELKGLARAAPQKKCEVHYALNVEDGKVFLVQREREASLMAGMWELPDLLEPDVLQSEMLKKTAIKHKREILNQRLPVGDHEHIKADYELMFKLRHSITVTDFTVSVWSGNAPVGANGQWVGTERLERIPLTGLARKILRKAKFLVAPKVVRPHAEPRNVGRQKL